MAANPNTLEAKLQRPKPQAPRPLHASTMENAPSNYSEKFKSIIQGNQITNSRIPYTGHSSTNYNPSYLKHGSQQPIALRRPRLSTYKSTSVTMHTEYDVIVCNIENGPKLFSVQLKSSLDHLKKMMLDLENIPLAPLESISIGTACLARYSYDNCLYRAVITAIHSNACSVAYIDYGHSEKVPCQNLYMIPENFLEYNTFSIKFSLTGCKNLELTPQVKTKFRDLVLLQEVKLKVTPLDGPPLYQYCELYLNGKNVLEILKNSFASQILFREPDPLENNEVVIIRYINSPRDFYVQKLKTLKMFENMMDALNAFCKNNHRPLQVFRKGLPCGLLFDDHYYRGEIVSDFCHGEAVQVQHVDFGYTHMIEKKNVCVVPPEIIKLPRQAIHCCLKGFEDESSIIRESVVTQFEMLSEKGNGDRSAFFVTVLKEYQDGSYLVNLKSEEGLDLMKKLYKLSQPFNKYIDLEKKEQQLQMNSTSASNDMNVMNDTVESENNRNRQPNGPNRIVREPINANARVAFESRNSSIASDDKSSEVRERQQTPFRNVNNNVVDQQQFRKPSIQDRLSVGRDSNFNHPASSQSTHQTTNGHKIYNQNGTAMDEQIPTITIDDSIVEEYVSFDTPFPIQVEPLNTKHSVSISWWFSPFQFYLFNKNGHQVYDKMFKQMSEFYKNKQCIAKLLNTHSYVIAFNRPEQKYYRGKIIATNAKLRKYKVYLVDSGHVIIISADDVFEVEKRFTVLPRLAKLCSLQGIVANVEHSTTLPTLESMLHISKPVNCEFLKYDEKNEMYTVNLLSNGKSVIDEMCKLGSWSRIGDDIDFDFLKFQQIRATVVSVQNMLHFMIKIEGFEHSLSCAIDDLPFAKSNQDKVKQFKNFYENKSFVFNISNVTADKIIFLSPLSKIFHPDEPSYICRFPLIKNEIKVRVVHVQDYNRVFVHLLENESLVHKLSDDLFNYYENGGNRITSVKEQQICAAKSSDGSWYRAKVTKIYPTTDKVQVSYFDYGNFEDVEKSNIKHIENEFCLFSSALAIELFLPIGNKKDDEKTVITNELQTLTDNVVLKAKILDCYVTRFIADLEIEGYCVLDILKNKGLIQEPNIQETHTQINNQPFDLYEFIETVDLTKDEEEIVAVPPPKAPAKEPVIVLDVEELNSRVQEMSIETNNVVNVAVEAQPEPVINPHADKTEAFLSHCDSPTKFFLQLSTDMDELDKLQETLQIVAGSLPPLMRVVKGADCICNYSVDRQWYRARIIDSELLIVQFIDYGNKDALLETDIKNIKEPVKAERPPFCSEYSLAVIPKNTFDWCDEANQIFNNSLNSEPVYFEIIFEGELKTFINLFIGNVNVSEYLISSGFARPMETIPSNVVCFVSHINSLSDFYLQLESDSQGLNLMESYLAGYEKFAEISDSDFKEGMICAALFPDDSMWYRAKTLSKTSEGYKVLYIDYGNIAVTNQIRVLAPDMATILPLAKKCALRQPRDLKSWSNEAEAKFSEIAGLGETVFVVELKEPGEHVIVDLLVDGKNMLEDLEPLCEKKQAGSEDLLNASVCTSMHLSINEPDLSQPIEAIITHVNAPYDFYIQLSSSITKNEFITKSLNELPIQKIDMPVLGTVCGVFYKEYNEYYRGLINRCTEDQQYEIFFIDFGNEIIAPKDSLIVIPAEIRNIEALAIKCSLENDKCFRENNGSIAKFKDIVENYERVVIKIVDKDQKPWIIKVFGNEENLCEKLNNSLGNKVSESPSKDKLFNITFLESSNEFYIQDEEQAKVSGNIGEQLNNGNPLENLSDPKIGDICASFDGDATLYRAKITEILGDGSFKVHFIDFGNYTVSNDIKAVPESIKQEPACCQRCSVDGIKDEVKFLEAIDRYFGEQFKINIVESSGNDWKIDILINGTNITDELRQTKEALSTEPAINLVDSFKKCRVSSCVSPNDFYVTFNDDVNTMEKIKEILSFAPSFVKFENPKVGDFCIAKFEEDGGYYRAQVTTINESGNEVLFIDYGNSALAQDIRVVPEDPDLKNKNTRAKRCALENLSEVDFWSEQAIDVFNKIIDCNFNETFQVEILQTNTDPWIVRLFFNDLDVAKELIRKMQEPHKDLDTTESIVNDLVRDITELDTENSLILHSKDIGDANIHCSSGHGSMDVTPTS